MMISKKVVLVINGKGGTGKDTCIDSLADKFNICNISSIDPVRKIATYFGYDGKKDAAGRKFLSDLKLAASAYNNFPTKYIISDIRLFVENKMLAENYEPLEIFCTHIREAEEIDKLKAAMTLEFPDVPVVTVLVRSCKLTKAGEYGNVSDDKAESYMYDGTFWNNGDLDSVKKEFPEFVIGLLRKKGIEYYGKI